MRNPYERRSDESQFSQASPRSARVTRAKQLLHIVVCFGHTMADCSRLCYSVVHHFLKHICIYIYISLSLLLRAMPTPYGWTEAQPRAPHGHGQASGARCSPDLGQFRPFSPPSSSTPFPVVSCNPVHFAHPEGKRSERHRT